MWFGAVQGVLCAIWVDKVRLGVIRHALMDVQSSVFVIVKLEVRPETFLCV